MKLANVFLLMKMVGMISLSLLLKWEGLRLKLPRPGKKIWLFLIACYYLILL